jgi:N-acetylglucosaminyldiphosphoundecaprenol N-acetyl-beta-D-mannosaminyltransferase
MSIERINLIGVPVDVCEPENLENAVLELLAKPGTKQMQSRWFWLL